MSTSPTQEALTPDADGHSRRAVVLRLGASGLGGALLASRLLTASAQEATPAAGTSSDSAVGQFMAIRQYQFAPDHTMAELVTKVESGFMPIVSEVPGFVEYYLVETADGAFSISVFTDQAGAEESTKRAKDWVADALSGFFAGPPTVTTGTVGFHQQAS